MYNSSKNISSDDKPFDKIDLGEMPNPAIFVQTQSGNCPPLGQPESGSPAQSWEQSSQRPCGQMPLLPAGTWAPSGPSPREDLAFFVPLSLSVEDQKHCVQLLRWLGIRGRQDASVQQGQTG